MSSKNISMLETFIVIQNCNSFVLAYMTV